MQETKGSNPFASTGVVCQRKVNKRARRLKSCQDKGRLRDFIVHEQGGLCYYCRRPLMVTFWGHADQDPTLDHVRPRCQGGRSDRANLVAACRKCNSLKGGMSLPEFRFLTDVLYKSYWPSRLAMPDVQKDLLGHIVKIDGRLWAYPRVVLPRMWVVVPKKPLKERIREFLKWMGM